MAQCRKEEVMAVAFLRKMWNNISTVIVCAVITGSVSLNLLQALKYRAAITPHTGGIKVGSMLKRIPVVELDGRKREIVLDGTDTTVLYVMAPGCPWCTRNLENIRTLASHSGRAVRFIGLSNTANGLDHYLASTSLPFPVSVVDLDHLPEGLNVAGTPQMALVQPDGRVVRVWAGALAGSTKAEVEQYFHVKLPGWRDGKNGTE
jgi:hypothetical protein